MSGMVKFGILGCGVVADYHAKAVRSIGEAMLCGVADQSADRAEAFADQYGVKAYRSYAEMLADPEIDAVCICTPSGMHAQNALEALAAGKHVVVEKPMALNTADADKMIRACRESGKLLTVICQLRFSKGVNRLRKLVEEQAFGTIGLCDLDMKYWRSPEYYEKSPWKGTIKMDGGGALMNQGIHGVDALLYILGDAKLLSARVKTVYHKIEVEDTAVATLEFENGALGVIEASTCTNPGCGRRLMISGSNGSAILREGVIEKLVIGDQVLVNEAPIGNCNTASSPTNMTHLLHTRQITNFVNAIQGKEALLIDANEGRRAVALIESIYQKSIEDERKGGEMA